jgi:colanic acid biosynthesis glycosyl transferase WcaI
MLAQKQRILIYGINYYPEMVGIGKYTSEMVDWMVDNGIECTVVTAYPYYPYWKVQKPYKNIFYKREVSRNGKLVVYRCPLYIPSKPSGFNRIIHDASFLLTSFLIFIKLIFGKKYDYVLSIAPPFHSGFLALFYKFFRNTKTIYHVQDLQIDAAKNLKMVKSGFLISMLMTMEKFCIKRFDFVSSISEGMIEKIKLKYDRDILNFPNWVDTEKFYPIEDKNLLKKQWLFDENDFIILYSGNIGKKQGLDSIIYIAEKFKSDQKIKFVICGEGAYKTTLINFVKEKKLNNITFLPLQESSVFNSFLNIADIHLILQKKSASDLVMPSKLTTILAVGGLVVATADQGTSLYNVIQNNKIGLIAPPEDPEALGKLILDNVNVDNNAVRERASSYAIDNLSKGKIMTNFMSYISK